MIRAIIFLLIAILGIFFLVVTFAFDFATSVIPGWHTTIFAQQDFLWIPLYLWGAFIISCYIIAARKKRKINNNVTITYLLLTVPYLLILTYFNAIGSQGYEYDLFLAPKFLIPGVILFLIGQLFFLYQLIKIMHKKQM